MERHIGLEQNLAVASQTGRMFIAHKRRVKRTLVK